MMSFFNKNNEFKINLVLRGEKGVEVSKQVYTRKGSLKTVFRDFFTEYGNSPFQAIACFYTSDGVFLKEIGMN
ncbi:hypothetical protein bcgnr5390_11240 [Bacillus luti]|nr:hypothetical protein BC2903_29670 [Bacillus cereus]